MRVAIRPLLRVAVAGILPLSLASCACMAQFLVLRSLHRERARLAPNALPAQQIATVVFVANDCNGMYRGVTRGMEHDTSGARKGWAVFYILTLGWVLPLPPMLIDWNTSWHDGPKGLPINDTEYMRDTAQALLGRMLSDLGWTTERQDHRQWYNTSVSRIIRSYWGNFDGVAIVRVRGGCAPPQASMRPVGTYQLPLPVEYWVEGAVFSTRDGRRLAGFEGGHKGSFVVEGKAGEVTQQMTGGSIATRQQHSFNWSADALRASQRGHLEAIFGKFTERLKAQKANP